jgi:hypothetical protein
MLGDQITFTAAGRNYLVGNLSETGLSLKADDLEPATRLKGMLHFAGKENYIELEVVRQHEGEAGARLTKGGDSLGAEMQKFFADELQATLMSEVSSGHLQTEEAGKPHWFYAPGNYELYFAEKEGRILSAEISWNDHLVCAKTGEKSRSGRLPEESREKAGHAKSSLIQWQSTLTDADRYKALRIVENIRGLDAWKEQLITLFRN